ncbi:MAG: hypothetical protein V8S08_13765, partial [Lachnoclostridium sp.]
CQCAALMHAAKLEKALFSGNFELAATHILPVLLYGVLITVLPYSASQANEKTVREEMKYKLIIDKNAEEEIIAVVHVPSSLTQQIENLVCSYSGEDYIMGYRDDEIRKLAFSEIECITILNRKVIAIDTGGNHFSLKDRLRDLQRISYPLTLSASTNQPLQMSIVFCDLMRCSAAVWMPYFNVAIGNMFPDAALRKSEGGMKEYEKICFWSFCAEVL